MAGLQGSVWFGTQWTNKHTRVKCHTGKLSLQGKPGHFSLNIQSKEYILIYVASNVLMVTIKHVPSYIFRGGEYLSHSCRSTKVHFYT